jgi:RNA polymerase sigma factor (sigma-70 family)
MEGGGGQSSAAAVADDLYRLHAPRMIALASLMCGSRAVAEDLVHDAFAATLPKFDEVESPAAYLRAAVVNRCLAWRGRQAVERERRPPPRSEREEPPDTEMLDLLRQLPLDQRVALVLRFYEDLPGEQIALVMNQRPATVRSHIHRGLAALKEMIER